MNAYFIVFLGITAWALLTALDLPAGEGLRQQEVWTLTPSSGNHPLIIKHQIWSSGFLFPPVSTFIILSSVGAAAACFHTTSVITKHYTHTHTHSAPEYIKSHSPHIYWDVIYRSSVAENIQDLSLQSEEETIRDCDGLWFLFCLLWSFCSSFLPVLMTLLVKS